MGMIEELLKNKEELLIKFLEILQGKETTVKIDLSGVEFKLGKITVQLDGDVSFTLIPKGKKKK